MAELLEITQDLERGTVTINGVVYASVVFRWLSDPDPSKLYRFTRAGDTVTVEIVEPRAGEAQ